MFSNICSNSFKSLSYLRALKINATLKILIYTQSCAINYRLKKSFIVTYSKTLFFIRKSDADRLYQLYDIARNISGVKSDYDGLFYSKNGTVISSLNKSSITFPGNYTEYDYIDYSNYQNEQGLRDK